MQYSVKEMLRISRGDSMLLSKTHQVFEMAKQGILERERRDKPLDENERKMLELSEYRVVKALHGRRHPVVHQMVYKTISDHLEKNQYFGYTQRNRVFKYFQIMDKSREGFDTFLEIFKKNHTYSNMGGPLCPSNC